MPIPYENWTVLELIAGAKRTGVTFSLDEGGNLQVKDVSDRTPAALISYITQRWAEIERYLRDHPQL